jgi:hypothetical protein
MLGIVADVDQKAIKLCGYGAAILAALLLLPMADAQYPPPNAPPPAAGALPGVAPGAQMSPQQMDDLVAPIALYPDPLVAQVLAASTYPMEIAEAEQWVQDHRSWKPSKLVSKARKENWDPSVQALTAFPDVLGRLSQNIGWTTQLGNAFLAQQADVMQAVQHMRAAAQAKGTLRSGPQETVTTQNQGGQMAIEIEPANPDTWYVPNYNPMYAYGPAAWGMYPPWAYPGIDVGFGWGGGIDLGLCFGGWGGWGWGGWGWSPNWFGGGLFIGNSFFNRYGYRNFGGRGELGTSAWAHDAGHRLGVPYGNREVANRFAGNRSGASNGARAGVENRGQGQQRMGSSGFEQRGHTENHSAFGGYHNGGATRMQSDRGFSSMGGGRSFGGGGGGMRGGGGGGHGGGGHHD